MGIKGNEYRYGLRASSFTINERAIKPVKEILKRNKNKTKLERENLEKAYVIAASVIKSREVYDKRTGLHLIPFSRWESLSLPIHENIYAETLDRVTKVSYQSDVIERFNELRRS